MSLDTRIGRLSLWAVLLMVSVAGCTSQTRQTDGMSELDRHLATCEGRDLVGLSVLPIEPEVFCENMILGFAEGFAAIGRNQLNSEFCVESGFLVQKYREEFLAVVGEKGIAPETDRRLLTADVQPENRDEKDCNWIGMEKLEGLGRDCRWGEALVANDKYSVIYDMFIETGSYSLMAARRNAAEDLSHCLGYLAGFVGSGILARSIDEDLTYCVDDFHRSDREPSPRDLTSGRLAVIATAVSKPASDRPEQSNEPAGQHVFNAVAKEFPC